MSKRGRGPTARQNSVKYNYTRYAGPRQTPTSAARGPTRGAAVKHTTGTLGPLRGSAVKPSSLGGPLRGAAVKTSIGQRVRQTASKPRRPPGPYYPPQS